MFGNHIEMRILFLHVIFRLILATNNATTTIATINSGHFLPEGFSLSLRELRFPCFLLGITADSF